MDIAFFSSPIGLGHVSRDVAICTEIPDASITLISGGAAAGLARHYIGDVRDAYRPPGFEVSGGRLQKPLRWLWQYYRYYKRCSKVASDIIAKNRPRLVVSDEDFASLAVAQSLGIPSVLITDILETSFVSGMGDIIEKRMNRAMKDIIAKADAVIMPEEGRQHENIHRVSPIVRRVTRPREEIRRELGFEGYTALCTIGGTASGEFLLSRIQECADILNGIEFVAAPGPSITTPVGRVRNLGFMYRLHEAVMAADLVISLAGRSTIDEAAACGTPGIFIPIAGHFEQEANAGRAGFSHADADNLETLIRDMPQRRQPILFDGAARAARIISEYARIS